MAELHAASQKPARSDEPPRAQGIGVISDLWCPPFDDHMSDVIVDFDVHSVAGSGLYALELISAGVVRWRGFREFRSQPDGQLLVDTDGAGATYAPAQFVGQNFRVAGKVLEVRRREATPPTIFTTEVSHG